MTTAHMEFIMKILKKMPKEHYIEPSKIKKIYITHADADHAGVTWYFEEEYETQIYFHPSSKGIIENGNHAYGNWNLSFSFELNLNFQKIGNPSISSQKGFTKVFLIIDYFQLEEIEFKVLESLGRTYTWICILLSDESGLFFTGDYLLYVPSLSEDEGILRRNGIN